MNMLIDPDAVADDEWSEASQQESWWESQAAMLSGRDDAQAEQRNTLPRRQDDELPF